MLFDNNLVQQLSTDILAESESKRELAGPLDLVSTTVRPTAWCLGTGETIEKNELPKELGHLESQPCLTRITP